MTDRRTRQARRLQPFIANIGSAVAQTVVIENILNGFDVLTAAGDMMYLDTNSFSSNLDTSGAKIINEAPSTTERVVLDCDLTLTPVGYVDITVNLWASASSFGNDKTMHARVRRDHIAGSILYDEARAPNIDSTAGHNVQWSTTFRDASPTNGQYVLTTQTTSVESTAAIYSDSRVFILSTPQQSPNHLPIGSVGQSMVVSAGTLPAWETYHGYSTASVGGASPTAAALGSAFGTPTSGFCGLIDQGNAGTSVWQVSYGGTSWYYGTAIKAV